MTRITYSCWLSFPIISTFLNLLTCQITRCIKRKMLFFTEIPIFREKVPIHREIMKTGKKHGKVGISRQDLQSTVFLILLICHHQKISQEEKQERKT